MKLSEEDVDIIVGAYREIVLGTGINKLDEKVSYTKTESEQLVDKIENKRDSDDFSLSCGEIKMVRNLLTDLLRELDAFEFSTRLGYEMDEVFLLFKRVKKAVDSTCY